MENLDTAESNMDKLSLNLESPKKNSKIYFTNLDLEEKFETHDFSKKFDHFKGENKNLKKKITLRFLSLDNFKIVKVIKKCLKRLLE